MKRNFWMGLMAVCLLLLSGCTASTPVPSGDGAARTEPAPLSSPTVSVNTPQPTLTAVPPTETPVKATRTAVVKPTTTLTPTEAPPFVLSSSAFEDLADIPAQYTCGGEDISPPLAWSEPPAGTISLVLILDDPDAVPIVGYVWDHWVMVNIPASVRGLTENIPTDETLADGSIQGKNSFGSIGYGGPCPPGDQKHGYIFSLYALDTTLELKSGVLKKEVMSAIDGHVLAEAHLVGFYR